MANAKTCDACGQSPAHRIEVSVALWNVAREGSPTANIQGADACESCQEHVIGVLQRHAVEALREQVPIHLAMVQAEDARDAATRTWEEYKKVVAAEHAKASAKAEAYKGQHPGKPAPEPEALMDAEVRAKRDTFLETIAAHEAARVTAWEEGNTLAADRGVRLAADLKKLPKS